MKQSNIIRAYRTITNLSEQKLPLAVSHKLWTVMRTLTPHIEFQREKEQEVIGKYKYDVAPDGTVKFESQEAEEAFKQEYAKTVDEIANLEVDLDGYKKVILHFDDKIDLSVDDVEALSDFVEFAE